MSHVNTKETIIDLKQYLEQLEDVIKISTINKIFDKIIPKDQNGNKITGTIVTSGKTIPIIYLPKSNTINVSINYFEKETEKYMKQLCHQANIQDDKTITKLKAYYRLYALLYENEHALQFAIAKNEYPFKYEEVKEGYQNIIEHLTKNNLMIPIQSKEKSDSLSLTSETQFKSILNRNARVEALSDIITILGKEKEEEIREILNSLYLTNLLAGYEETTKGSMYTTHKELLLLNKYKIIKRDILMSEDERLRFGLEINNETRNKLLAKINT